jgi:hypothetical protein
MLQSGMDSSFHQRKKAGRPADFALLIFAMPFNIDFCSAALRTGPAPLPYEW